MKNLVTVFYPLLVSVLKSALPHLYDALIGELATNKLFGIDITPAVAAELSTILTNLKPTLFPTPAA